MSWSGSTGEAAARPRRLTVPLAVAIVTAALYVARLGAAPFLDPPEGIHAQIAWEMLRGGDWITPNLNGVPYFDKPPRPYWLMAGAFAWLGPSEAAARLVSALSTVLVAVLTALIGARLASARVGLMAGLMVVANLEAFPLSASTPARSVVRELPPERVHLLVEGGGQRLYSNRR